MSERLHAVLHSVGVYWHYCGYHYFTEAIFMAAEEPERLQSIRKEIYLPIALKNRTTISNVEKNIRTIRDVMLWHGGGELLTSLTGGSYWHTRKPYPKDLISVFAEYFVRDKGAGQIKSSQG